MNKEELAKKMNFHFGRLNDANGKRVRPLEIINWLLGRLEVAPPVNKFEPSKKLSQAAKYWMGGESHLASDQHGIMFSVICKNCGKPNGDHGWNGDCNT